MQQWGCPPTKACVIADGKLFVNCLRSNNMSIHTATFIGSVSSL